MNLPMLKHQGYGINKAISYLKADEYFEKANRLQGSGEGYCW